ncbi:MAG: hypothetical protein ACYC6Y_13195, partial [Thermoguttaceae bacterium]
RDGSITLWDVAGRGQVFHVGYRTLPITRLAFGADGRFLLVGDGEGTIGRIDLEGLRRDLGPLGLGW